MSHHLRGEVRIGVQAWPLPLLVPWHGPVLPWAPRNHQDLRAEHFDAVLALRPELVILGSGPTLKFFHPQLLRALIDARIGVETMDTAAACRTYNVLVSEGRRAVAALLDSSPI